MRVLVAGATGETGVELIHSLARAGHAVGALVRPASRGKLAALGNELADVREADVTQPDTLGGCCDGYDVVISTITRTRPGDRHWQVDYEGNCSLLREAERAGVRRFIFVSSLGAGQVPGIPVLEQKARFEVELGRSRVSSFVIRPSALFQDMARIFAMTGGKSLTLFGTGRQRVTPMAEADLADFITARLEGPTGIIEVGGPQTFAMDEIAALALSVSGSTARIRHVPIWVFGIFVRLAKVLRPDAYPTLCFVEYVFGSSNVAPEAGHITLESYFRDLAAARAAGRAGEEGARRLISK